MEESNAAKLKRVIALAIENDPHALVADIARGIKARESATVIAWAMDQVEILVNSELRHRAKLSRPPGPYQEFLEGFGDLLERLPLPRRGRVPLNEATIVDLRNSLKMTRGKARERNARTAKLIKEMWPYARTRRGLTVEAYLQLRAAGIRPRVPKTTKRRPFDEEDD